MPLSFDKIPAGLHSLVKTAAVSLEKHRIAGRRACVYLVLDRSGSMRRYYRDGSIQHLAEQALGLSANLDDDGVVPLVFFDTTAHPPTDLSIDNYTGSIGRLHDELGHMGTTNYADAMDAVIDHYLASEAQDPAFVIFQTDGSPDSRSAAQRVLCKAAALPMFWQFVGFGNDSFKFLRKLDDLPVPRMRVVDNAGFFPAGKNPRSMDDATLYDQLMNEFPQWLDAARAAGILR
ncbi:VWA domain-containing protein [Streptomyces sp. NBC_01089]|uniref:VWA domain-containing protein n=1 Tax=Streptomyces sp. NBC_01089 TaxID=2903747 RepID=UPI00386725E8|nr:VWA domain-containing protein [Streptomyces sp. NBC_01089]